MKKIEHLIIYQEKIDNQTNNVIIDIETIGEFDNKFRNDSRYYRNIMPTIFGFIDKDILTIICAKGKSGFHIFNKQVIEILKNLKERQNFAFNCPFEIGVFYQRYKIQFEFHGELNKHAYESKRNAVKNLEINQFGDPYFDDGKKCISGWLKNSFNETIAHNRACLLKELEILKKRGHRKPDKLIFTRDNLK